MFRFLEDENDLGLGKDPVRLVKYNRRHPQEYYSRKILKLGKKGRVCYIL